jgi:hypothetical protein
MCAARSPPGRASGWTSTPRCCPPELKRQALWLIVESIKTDASVALGMTEEQVRMCDNARKDLMRVSEGSFSVSAPLNRRTRSRFAVGRGRGASPPARPRLFGRDNTAGL